MNTYKISIKNKDDSDYITSVIKDVKHFVITDGKLHIDNFDRTTIRSFTLENRTIHIERD